MKIAALIALTSAPTLAAAGPGDVYGPGPGFSIPDFNGAGVSSQIVITDSGTIEDLDITLSGLSHTWLGDLIITLTHEDSGTMVDISNRAGRAEGGDANAGFNIDLSGDYTIDDESANGSLHDQFAFNGGTLPEGNYASFEPLSAFDGLDIAGTWTLSISDNASSDTGSLGSWSLLAETEDDPCGPSGLFAPSQEFDAGEFPFTVAIGDMNGDGNNDLVVTNRFNDTVSFRAGRGDGTFVARRFFSTGDGPLSVAIGDLNGDGDLDLAVANITSDSVSVLLGRGNGIFDPRQDFPVIDGPQSLAIGDLNGDGRPDLAVTNSALGVNRISVFLADSRLGVLFQPRVDYLIGGTPTSLAIGDVSGDGNPDIVVASESIDRLFVLEGDGNGVFDSVIGVAVIDGPRSVAIGDLDGDGSLDIALGNYGTATILVMPTKDYPLSFLNSQVFTTAGLNTSVAIGDLNGDGLPDLVTTNLFNDTVSVLCGNGNGDFRRFRSFATDRSPRSVAIGDFNQDGRPDLAVANAESGNASSGNVSVLLNQCMPPCPADFNGDAVANIIDVVDFIITWNMQGPGSDFNGDGIVNILDVVGFIATWNLGCP